MVQKVSAVVASIGSSVVRTVVPVIVGTLLGWAARIQFDLDVGLITEAVTVIVTTLYYVVVRLLETRVAPAWGYLLGIAKVPTYAPPGN
jgi:hypothetical protein